MRRVTLWLALLENSSLFHFVSAALLTMVLLMAEFCASVVHSLAIRVTCTPWGVTIPSQQMALSCIDAVTTSETRRHHQAAWRRAAAETHHHRRAT